MAFIYNDDDTVLSFADYDDVYDTDSRIFDANESLSESNVTMGVTRATERLLLRLKSTSWWRNLNKDNYSNPPALDTKLIIGRHAEFTDLCVYIALAEYILPGVADFANPDDAERQKMDYYNTRAAALFVEIINAGDFYDINNDGDVTNEEIKANTYVVKRIR